jgi:hypothetical protein
MRQHILIVATDTHIPPQLLTDAVGDALARSRDEIRVVRVVIPAVVPPTLPITAWPPRLAARLGALRDAAEGLAETLQPRGRVEIVPCRSVAALLQAVWPVDSLVLVGGSGWSVRRAARGVAPDVVVVPSRAPVPRREPTPASQRKALPSRR